jgi:hypothetical protein
MHHNGGHFTLDVGIAPLQMPTINHSIQFLRIQRKNKAVVIVGNRVRLVFLKGYIFAEPD